MTLPETHNTQNMMDMMDQSAYWPAQRTDHLPLGSPTTEGNESHLQLLYGMVGGLASTEKIAIADFFTSKTQDWSPSSLGTAQHDCRSVSSTQTY